MSAALPPTCARWPASNGKVGVIGYCSGGRQSFLAACSLPLDAAVDCYGAFVVKPPAAEMPLKVSRSSGWPRTCPARCSACSAPTTSSRRRRRQRSSSKVLDDLGKEHEFHTYEGAGHAFFSVDRPAYRVEAANDGWAEDLGFLRPLPGRLRELTCARISPSRSRSVAAARARSGWFSLSDASVYFDHPVHAMAEHTLNIDFVNSGQGPVRAGGRGADRRVGAGAGQGDRGHPGVGAAGHDGLTAAT